MRFKDVLGHEDIKRRLANTVTENRVSHAQLFLGPPGSGNLALALAYAQYINCTQKQDNDSCGLCPSCKKYQKLIHPDLHFIYPITATKAIKKPLSKLFLEPWRELVLEKEAVINLNDWYRQIEIENKQAIINAEDANEIIKTLSYKSYESEYKVMIIWMPERFFHSAIPKILKILEEPPEKTLFLLVAEQSDKILQTILSRTQMVKLYRLKDEEIVHELVHKHAVDEMEAHKIAAMAEGNLIQAKQLINQAQIEKQNFETFREWFRLCWKFNMDGLIEFSQKTAKIGREPQKQFLNYGLRVVRHAITVNYIDASHLKLDPVEMDFIVKLSPFINPSNIIQFTEELEKAAYHIERNANPNILFMDLSLKFAKLIHSKPKS
ncbi:MAG: DNA polymerase III subunit delta [Bacteroidales bacterium]|nr:DNA polymerase III subunit delta [Bacteroidales bacterium]